MASAAIRLALTVSLLFGGCAAAGGDAGTPDGAGVPAARDAAPAVSDVAGDVGPSDAGAPPADLPLASDVPEDGGPPAGTDVAADAGRPDGPVDAPSEVAPPCPAAACCTPGTAEPLCDDGDPCTDDLCDDAGRGCVHTERWRGCTLGGACANVADCPPLDDPCRATLCRGGRCVTLDAVGPCDDGDFCTEGDACVGGRCVAGPPRDCAQGPGLVCPPPCSPRCDVAASACLCDCPNACDIPRNRRTGCRTGADCDDGDPCTTDSCRTLVSPSVCSCVERRSCRCDPTAPDGGFSACDDGIDTTLDHCCAGPDDPYVPCGGQRGCEPAGYCVHPLCGPSCAADEQCDGLDDDDACDDGQKCTIDDCELLSSGVGVGDDRYCCRHARLGPPCGLPCQTDSQCADGSPCTTDRCGADGTCDAPGLPDLCR